MHFYQKKGRQKTANDNPPWNIQIESYIKSEVPGTMKETKNKIYKIKCIKIFRN